MDPQPDHLLVEFVNVSSYGSGTTSKGAVLNEDFDLNKVKGKHVLVVGASTRNSS
jgi:hypoxanthine-guanine phosphoribosyltransferase